MEQNRPWELISRGTVAVGGTTVGTTASALYELVLPVMQCKSGGISPGESRISYVANAGPLNLAAGAEEFGLAALSQKTDKVFTVFFDHFAVNDTWDDVAAGARCVTKISVDNISNMSGTSMTVLISENEDAGRWIWYGANIARPVAGGNLPVGTSGITAGGTTGNYYANGAVSTNVDNIAEVESHVGFCYPNISGTAAITNVDTYPTYPAYSATTYQPLFINEGRASSPNPAYNTYQRTRPSSGHPGLVVAAFCDGGTRTLKDDINKTVFVQLCRPDSGLILNPKDLGW
jgi:hypothetical protein